MTRHELKTDPDVFDAVARGVKTHEIRKNDRGFAVGDELLLRETVHSGVAIRAGANLIYTGRELVRTVSHILTGYGLLPGWCILSFAPVVTSEAPELYMGVAVGVDHPGATITIMEKRGAITTVHYAGTHPVGETITRLPIEQAATVTLDGHQLREALDFLNPDGNDDTAQRDDWLTFGVRQHRDDDGKVSTGMCCWNEDSDGVLPLDGEPKAGAAS